MTRVYRILRKPYSEHPLDGEGAYRFGGRWSSPGVRIAYTSEHVSLAMVEYFVHLAVDDPPPDLILVTAEIPDEVPRMRIEGRQLPENWRSAPGVPELSAVGDHFALEGKFAILVVPSAVVPSECNWLINPQHDLSKAIRVLATEEFVYDARFFRA